MPQKISELNRPSGITKLFFKAPIILYRINLGRLLGSRFLLLEHIGRKSGLRRQTVLEIVYHDKEENDYYIASGWGEKSDWMLNIRKNPKVKIQVGSNKMAAKVHFLTHDEAGEVLLNYGKKHPTALRELARYMGYVIENNDEEYFALGEFIPVIRLATNSKD